MSSFSLKDLASPELTLLEVETPLGHVLLAGFRMASPHTPGKSHRQKIFEILSRVAGRLVSSSDLVESDGSRPAFPGLGFDVNWTHSGDLCVLAVAERGAGMRVGVDVELHSDRRLNVAKRFFNPEEVALLESLDDDALEQKFFQLWCRKEALYKCVGGTFIEGTLKKSVLSDVVEVETSSVHGPAYFVDVYDERFYPCKNGVPLPASLCVAVSQ